MSQILFGAWNNKNQIFKKFLQNLVNSIEKRKILKIRLFCFKTILENIFGKQYDGGMLGIFKKYQTIGISTFFSTRKLLKFMKWNKKYFLIFSRYWDVVENRASSEGESGTEIDDQLAKYSTKYVRVRIDLKNVNSSENKREGWEGKAEK